MVNHETNQVFIDNLEIPVENLIGEEGKGFRYILDGLNAERILIAAECIGDGYWFIEKSTHYAKDRVVFDRPIGQNQGIQFPIAEAYMEIEAANLMRYKAAALFDAQKPCGAEANMAKHLAAKASWEAANVCLQTHGGFGFAAEYDVERKFRENAPLPRRADLDQPDPLLPRRARARPAAALSEGAAWTRATRTPVRGIVLMLLATCCFGCLDTMSKYPGRALPRLRARLAALRAADRS